MCWTLLVRHELLARGSNATPGDEEGQGGRVWIGGPAVVGAGWLVHVKFKNQTVVSVTIQKRIQISLTILWSMLINEKVLFVSSSTLPHRSISHPFLYPHPYESLSSKYVSWLSIKIQNHLSDCLVYRSLMIRYTSASGNKNCCRVFGSWAIKPW